MKKPKKQTKKQLAVFCQDGSYSGGNFAVLDVSNFTASDWIAIAEQCDDDRLYVAKKIAKHRNTKKYNV